MTDTLSPWIAGQEAADEFFPGARVLSDQIAALAAAMWEARSVQLDRWLARHPGADQTHVLLQYPEQVETTEDRTVYRWPFALVPRDFTGDAPFGRVAAEGWESLVAEVVMVTRKAGTE